MFAASVFATHAAAGKSPGGLTTACPLPTYLPTILRPQLSHHLRQILLWIRDLEEVVEYLVLITLSMALGLAVARQPFPTLTQT